MAPPFGFFEEIHIAWSNPNVTTQNSLVVFTEVPPGEIWIITRITATVQHRTATITFNAHHDTEDESFATITAYPAPASLTWNGAVALIPGQQIRVPFFVLSLPYAQAVDLYGYKMNIP